VIGQDPPGASATVDDDDVPKLSTLRLGTPVVIA
jgi:hypothetical protein